MVKVLFHFYRPLPILIPLPHKLPDTSIAEHDLDKGRLCFSVFFVGKGKLEGGQSSFGWVVMFAAGICTRRLACARQHFVLGPPTEGKLKRVRMAQRVLYWMGLRFRT